MIRPTVRQSRHIWLLVILLYALLLPKEVRLSLGDLVFFADRIVSIACLPIVFLAYFERRLSINIADALVLVGSLLIVVTMGYHYGISGGVERGGALALDTVMAYFIGRYSVRSVGDLRAVIRLIAPGMVVVGLTMAFESIRGSLLVKPVFANIFGPLPFYDNGMESVGQALPTEFRLGFLRASGPFSHPILGGVILSSVLPLYLLGGIKGWRRWAGIVGSICGFFSLSSAALIGLVTAALLIGYEIIQRRVAFLSWQVLMYGMGAVLLVAQLGSQNGLLSVIVRYLTLNPATGGYRMLIYEYGLQTAYRSPFFGIGFAGYDRPAWMVSSSIDSQWLILALRHGIPTSLMFMALAIVVVVMLAKAARRAVGPDELLYKALAFVLFLLGILGFTVAYFGGANSWYLALTGAGISLVLNDLAQRRAAAAMRSAETRRSTDTRPALPNPTDPHTA